MKKTVVFDIDGVLRDFEGALLETLASKHGGTAYRKRHEYSFEKRFEGNPVMIEEMLAFVNNPESYKNIASIDPMIDFAYECAEKFDVLFLSSCPQGVYQVTIRWLRDQGLNISREQVYCGVKDKAGWLKRYGADVGFVVEDSPDNIKHLQEAGFTAYAWSQPWNEGVFPRLEIRNDGELMVWTTESTESFPFVDLYAEVK